MALASGRQGFLTTSQAHAKLTVAYATYTYGYNAYTAPLETCYVLCNKRRNLPA